MLCCSSNIFLERAALYCIQMALNEFRTRSVKRSSMSNREKILWITRKAVFIAVLVVLQAVTKPLGQYVTGSLVNLVLVLSVMLGGLWCGATVALLSPVFALLVGIGPAFPPLLPFIMLGNLTLVLVWHLLAGKAEAKTLVTRSLVATAVAALAKFTVLYLGIVQLAIPYILQLEPQQVIVLSASFSFPQLITALFGGLVASAVLPTLRKALRLPA